MNEEVFNTSIRKFLRMVGVKSQQSIEQAVNRALAKGSSSGGESYPAKMTLRIEELGLEVTFEGEIKLE